MMPPPKMTRLSSSDTEDSLLREIDPRRGGNRRSISVTLSNHIHHNNASTASSSDGLKNSKTSANCENIWKGSSGTNKSDAMKIRTMMRRAASVHASGPGRTPSYSGSRTIPRGAKSARVRAFCVHGLKLSEASYPG